MNKIYVCEEHVDIGIEKILDLNTLPIIEEAKQTETCQMCTSKSSYVVKSGDQFED